jgi:ankyrin repeat protein
MTSAMLRQIIDGRTDLVFEYLAEGHAPNCVDDDGMALIKWCAYYGDVSDCRTKGETPLHRAAAFGTEETIQLLLDAGALMDAKDMNGDSPLTWASWYLRPDPILRKLCYGAFRARAGRLTMGDYLTGEPHV